MGRQRLWRCWGCGHREVTILLFVLEVQNISCLVLSRGLQVQIQLIHACPGSTHSIGSGQRESKQPSPGKSKTSKEMGRLHQPSVVVCQPNLCLDVVNIADDDVDNPLSD